MSYVPWLPRLSTAPSPCAWAIGRKAVRALYAELMLYPKPGLVSAIDSGAHDDMDAATFYRSLCALRHYFPVIAQAGASGAPFDVLQELGVKAERTMAHATNGVNTHRGAIFSLGLLAAAAGWRHRRGLGFVGLNDTILRLWGDGIAAANRQSADSHGAQVVRRYGARGARDEALEGYPTLFKVAAPSLAATGRSESGMVQALFQIMAVLDDTNLLHRGGPEGLAFVQTAAGRFLERGGIYSPHWRGRALRLHRTCVERRLSPGGAADTLAAAYFIHSLTS